MSILSGDLYQLARIRYEDRQSEAEHRRASKKIREAIPTRSLDVLRELAVAIGVALLPFGESIRSSISEPSGIDITTQ